MIEAILYVLSGIIQGLLEWVPVSSKSNLVIFLMNFGGMNLSEAFNVAIMLHVGTVLAAIIYFRKDISNLLRFESIAGVFSNDLKFRQYKDESKYLKFIIIAVFLTFLIMGPLYLLAKDHLASINASIVLLLVGVLLVIIGIVQYASRRSNRQEATLSGKNASILGLFQGLTIIPGISRSGMTTSVLLFEGFTPENAFKISFLLSIPVVLIGEIGLIIINGFIFTKFILLGIIISFIVGYIMIDVILKIVKKIDFSYLCMGLGMIYIFIYLSSLIFNFIL